MAKFHIEYYDITDLVVDKAVKIMMVVCRIKKVKCDKISFSFKRFEHNFIRRWHERMYKEFPYDHNSKMAMSTDVSSRKIRDITNK